MLSMTKVELDLISDTSMYLFFKKGMEGGVNDISKWYSNANNKYLTFYDPKKLRKCIVYLDKIVYMVMLCQNLFQQVDLNGWIIEKLTEINMITVQDVAL